MEIKVKLINDGTMPHKAHANDACFDCYANDVVIIPAGKTSIVKLGFALQLPTNFEAQIRPRSGLSSKGILVHFGTVDENYRGEVGAIVTNLNREDFHVGKGDRICQMAIRMTDFPSIFFTKKYSSVEATINEMCTQTITEVEELDDTERGENGFGSSGI